MSVTNHLAATSGVTPISTGDLQRSTPIASRRRLPQPERHQPAGYATFSPSARPQLLTISLEKDRSRRYESAGGFAEDIRRHLRDEPVLAGPPTAIYRIRKLIRRKRALVLTTGVGILAILAGIFLAIGGLVRARHERNLAIAAQQFAEQAQREADSERQQAKQMAGTARKEELRSKLVIDLINEMIATADPRGDLPENRTVQQIVDQFANDLQ